MTTGFLVVDKPPGITSHDVVAIVRNVTGVEKVGHTGTLDPFATGVLPLALGGATKLIQYLDESMKVYDATIAFGAETDTGDPTGTTIATAAPPTADRAALDAVLATFLGPRMQAPPAYSAVKKDGRPLYAYAREGVAVEVEKRPIVVHALEVVAYDGASLRVRITCSRGTYARVLGVEIAHALGSVGHLSALARERSGPFVLAGALSFEALADIVSADPGRAWADVFAPRRKGGERVPWRSRDAVLTAIAARLVSPVDALAPWPIVEVPGAVAARIRRGAPPPACDAPRWRVVSDGLLVGVGEPGPDGPRMARVLDGA